MKIRSFGALLCGAALLLATQSDFAQAQSQWIEGAYTVGAVSYGRKKATGATTRATTVKSSKSNSSDRMGGGGGKAIAGKGKCVDGNGRYRPCSAGY